VSPATVFGSPSNKKHLQGVGVVCMHLRLAPLVWASGASCSAYIATEWLRVARSVVGGAGKKERNVVCL
jgi:hypothetical protein